MFYRHKFHKQGRTISANLDTRVNTKDGNGTLYSSTDYIDSTTTTDQVNNQTTLGTTWAGSLNYTEPLSKKSQLQINYNPSITHNESEKLSFAKDASGQYTIPVDSVSNSFKNDYTYHKAGIGYRYNSDKFNFNSTLNGQVADLQGLQTYPQNQAINRTFRNILPQAMMSYKISKTENLRIFYRSSTNAPTITQLQNVIDNSNTLQLKTGNPNLKQDYTNSVFMHYGKTSPGKGNGLFIFANATFTRDYIGNSTSVSPEGVQISMPVNLNGMAKINAFGNYSLPLKAVKSNLNLSTGVSFTQTPSLINDVLNKTKNYGLNLGFVLGSNISENVDFTISSNGAYTIANSSSQPQSNYNYYSQTSSAKINIIFLKRMVFNTNINHTLYTGLGEGYNQNFFLWNASLGYKLLKDKSLLLEVYAFDILNQNKSISRTVNDYYVEDSKTTVLQRYAMLRLTYTIRKFKGSAKMPEEDKSPEGEMHRRIFQNGPPPGAPPPPGGPGF
ncbi:MAG: outer membrane beta-barrel protein [Chitinophagaceae bacterium]